MHIIRAVYCNGYPLGFPLYLNPPQFSFDTACPERTYAYYAYYSNRRDYIRATIRILRATIVCIRVTDEHTYAHGINWLQSSVQNPYAYLNLLLSKKESTCIKEV